MKVQLISPESGDWEMLVIDGVVVKEGHSLRPSDVLDALKIEHESVEIPDDEWDDTTGKMIYDPNARV